MDRLARLLAIRPGEAGLVVRLAALFAVVEAARGVGEIGADTLVLAQLGPTALPYLYIGLGLTSLVAALGFGVAVGRLRRRPLFAAVLLGIPIVLVIERAALGGGGPAALPLVWLTIYVAGVVIGTLVWVLAGWVLDARQAKRVFPLCASAAILGGFVGMVSAGPVAGLVGTANLILVQALLLGLAAMLAWDTGRIGRQTAVTTRRVTVLAELRVGLDDVRRTPLLRLVALAYVLFAVLGFSVSYPFLTAMNDAFATEVELATALGLFSAATTAASFVVAALIANRVYARWGVATAALLLPLVYLAGFGVWLVRFSLATAVGFRFAQLVTQRGLSNAAWSAFYNTVPSDRRAQILAFMDGVPGQLGTILAGILLLVTTGLPTQAPVFVLGALAAVACSAIVVRVRQVYADSLVRTLRAGLAEQLLEGGPGLRGLAEDPAVVASLRTGLSDRDPAVRRLAAQLLGRIGASGSRSELSALLDDPEPDVRVAAIGALTAAGSRLPDTVTDRLVEDPSPAVRAEVAVAIIEGGAEDPAHDLLVELIEGPTAEERVCGLDAVARVRGHAPTPAILDPLDDPVPIVRAAAVRALAAVEPPPVDPIPILLRALDDEAMAVRSAAAGALARRGSEVCRRVLDVVRTGSDRASEAGLLALEGEGGVIREELVAWALGEVDHAARLRRQRSALERATGGRDREPDPGHDDGTLVFLAFVLARRERRIEDRVVQTLAVLGAPEASGLLRRSLVADDAETRALATEALDSIGDRRLGRAVVALLEGGAQRDRDVGPGVATGIAPSEPDILAELAGDDDPWTRTLAERAVAHRVRQAGGAPLPQTAETITAVDRMLVLRRVALFSQLAPEDLQRVAATATERVYLPGEALVREGDQGDELIVIVEGMVRVVHGTGNAARVVRTYGPGDHIGELAVLLDHPRAATVIAEGDGVRGLAISGPGLKSILRERPEAAMAMLATLAERLAAS